jgi:uncharacterized protein YbjT (DUF2867 family)
MVDKVIAVVGATGAQGGGLVRAIQRDAGSGYRARALTRDPDSEAARALARLGAEVVRADVDHPATLEAAFAGAHGAYCVTFFWEHFAPETEIAQARNMARAARTAGVKHVIWSTLEDTRKWVPLTDDRMPTLMERYKVPHFDAKGEADAVFTEAGVPTTFLLTSFYWDNLIHFGMGPRPGPDGTLELTLPMGDKPLPGIAAADIGACAYGVFKADGVYVDRRIGIAGEHLTGEQMAAELSRALGRPVRHHAMRPADYRALPFPGAADIGNMFQFKQDFNADFCAARDVELSRALNPGLLTFRRWLDGNASRIPLGEREASA